MKSNAWIRVIVITQLLELLQDLFKEHIKLKTVNRYNFNSSNLQQDLLLKC